MKSHFSLKASKLYLVLLKGTAFYELILIYYDIDTFAGSPGSTYHKPSQNIDAIGM